jgi:DNA invertase Pin-like site-specific DNA recombinase
MTRHGIGYARVSTRDQNLDLQRDALQKAGCDKIYKDTISGTKSQRPGLDQALDNLREGDTLVLWKLDRLGRSVKDVLDFAGGLKRPRRRIRQPHRRDHLVQATSEKMTVGAEDY